MMIPDLNIGGLLVFFCLVSAVVGWGVIELVLWLLSFVTITIA